MVHVSLLLVPRLPLSSPDEGQGVSVLGLESIVPAALEPI